jgi:hypothetical protein
MTRKQIQIEIANLSTDKTVVDQVLLMVLGKFDLYDNTDTSRVPDTIRSIVESKGFGFGLGARVKGDLILVDFNPRGRTASRFQEIYDFLLSKFSDVFSGKLKIVQEDDPAYIKVYE